MNKTKAKTPTYLKKNLLRKIIDNLINVAFEKKPNFSQRDCPNMGEDKITSCYNVWWFGVFFFFR